MGESRPGRLIMNENLISAQHSLRIQAVNLKDSTISVRENVDLPTIDRGDTISQVYRAVTKIQEASFLDPEKQEFWEYRFMYTSAIRLIFSDEEDSQNEGYKPIMEIAGVFYAIYLSNKKLSSEESKAFCDDSVGYHVWPYWREYVQSTCARIGFSPALEVPLYFMPQNGDEEKV